MRTGRGLVCGVDEVGRGALAGPVSVGAVVVDDRATPLPGVRDSKLLSPPARIALVPRIREWALACAVGHASAAEIDEVGLMVAMRRAGLRAMAGLGVTPDAVLLDGSHDWLSAPRQASLLDDPVDGDEATWGRVPPVTMRVKADLTCTSVAAASILAKVERDAIVTDLSASYPGYGWETNKGYASSEHVAALDRLGPCDQHRRTWRLGVTREGGA